MADGSAITDALQFLLFSLIFPSALTWNVPTVIGLLSEGDSASGSWILPFTAGGFIYIATGKFHDQADDGWTLDSE